MNIVEARAAAKFARITESKGTVSHKVQVPGHEGKHYLVLIRHAEHAMLVSGKPPSFKVVTGECLLDISKLGTPPACPSKSSTNCPCYHVLASLIAIAESQELEIAFAGDQVSAQRVKNLHAARESKMFRIGQHESYKFVWAITWKKENKS